MKTNRAWCAVTLAGLVVFAACQPQGTSRDAAAAVDTAAIRASLDSLRSAWEQAVSDGDWQRLPAMLSEDAMVAQAGGAAWDSVRAAASRAGTPFPPGSTMEIDSREVGVLSADWAYDMGTGSLTWTPEGTDEPRTVRDSYLVLLHRTADGWKVHREVASSSPLPGGGN